jgi:hypothetical protein
MGPTSIIDFMNLRVRHTESTDLGGTSYISAVAHARDAIAAGRCSVALITLAGRPRSEGSSGTVPRTRAGTPEAPWEAPYGLTTVNGYGMVAPARLLRGQRRRRCIDRGAPRDRARPEAARGQGDRQWRDGARPARR